MIRFMASRREEPFDMLHFCCEFSFRISMLKAQTLNEVVKFVRNRYCIKVNTVLVTDL